MAVKDHLTRVSKLRARITTVDPSQRIIEVATADGNARRLAVFDILPGFTWPKEGEEWSIYEENGQWVLGKKFLNQDEADQLEALAPGDTWQTAPIFLINDSGVWINSDVITDTS